MIRFFALLLVAAPVDAATTLITGARVFDGTGSPAKMRDVLIRDDRIVAVAKKVKRVPPATTVIDATGLTLLPGLHDLHVHVTEDLQSTGSALEQRFAPYLAAGVTTVTNFSVGPADLPTLRRLSTEMRLPHIRRALRLGVPDGHGTESARTRSITSLVSTPAQARAAMPGLVALEPDLFKVFADGWRYGDPARADKPGMDLPMLKAIVREAHRAKRMVVTHSVSLAGLRLAIDAGVDAVVHGTGDTEIDDATIRRMKARRVAYVPTMVVYEPQTARALTARDLKGLAPAARRREEARQTDIVIADWDARRWAALQVNLRRLHRAGVRIGIGTDAGITGVYHGWATLREIALYTRFGFTPRQTLAAATSVSAAIAGQRDSGRIARGQRADLLLTGGQPDVVIADLADTRRVFVGGREMPLADIRALQALADEEPEGGE